MPGSRRNYLVRRSFPGGYFLKRFSKAARASSGFDEEEVSRSIVVRGAKKEHSFRASFFGMRAVTGLAHSNRLAVSKKVHCLQLCSSAPQFGHFSCGSIPDGSNAAQEAHLQTERCPGMLGVRGPKVSSFFGCGRPLRSSPPESM
jgi:hypothetical protein